MRIDRRAGRTALLAVVFSTVTACASPGSLGNILGSVLGRSGSGNELTGIIQNVDAISEKFPTQMRPLNTSCHVILRSGTYRRANLKVTQHRWAGLGI